MVFQFPISNFLLCVLCASVVNLFLIQKQQMKKTEN
jgi:hypothetical protein